MDLSSILAKWKKFVVNMNDKGVPLPMVRDPNTLEGSVSLTLVVLSSIMVMVGIVGKWSGWLGGIDMVNAMQFFYASCTLYFGHTWVHKDSKDSAPAPDAPKDPPAGQDHSD
jgi:hypothetical protein